MFQDMPEWEDDRPTAPDRRRLAPGGPGSAAAIRGWQDAERDEMTTVPAWVGIVIVAAITLWILGPWIVGSVLLMAALWSLVRRGAAATEPPGGGGRGEPGGPDRAPAP